MANATTGFTSNPNQELSASPAGIVAFFTALNMFLSITASLGNVLALIALHRVSSIYPPTKLFFRCLAVTDLCVGLIVQPIYVMSHLTQMNMNVLYYVNKVYEASSFILCAVSILTSTAISVDRLLAILLGLRYRHVVTLRRVRVVIICFCLIGCLSGTMRMWRDDIAFKAAFVIIMLSLVTSIFSYTKIHLTIRFQLAQVQNHVLQRQPNGGGIPLNIARYKKTGSSILWVQLALVACYVPIDVVTVLYINDIKSEVTLIATHTLLFFNSSLNPILYCWKIRELRQQVKNTVRQLSCI